MGRISRFATRTAEAIHNVTAEPVADAAKFVASKAKAAKVAVAKEHEVQEAARAERKAKRQAEKAEEARQEALEATKELLETIFPDGAPTDPEALRAALHAHAVETQATEVPTTPAKPKSRTRKAQAPA